MGSDSNDAKIRGINGNSGRGPFRPQAAFLQQITNLVGSSLLTGRSSRSRTKTVASDESAILAPSESDSTHPRLFSDGAGL